MNRQLFLENILKVRDVLGHNHITDIYLKEFVKDYDIDQWTDITCQELFKQLKAESPSKRDVLSVNYIVESYIALEIKMAKQQYDTTFFESLKKQEKSKDTERAKKAKFISLVVQKTRNYKWEGIEKFRSDMKYTSLGQFQRMIVDAYGSERKNTSEVGN